MSTAAIPRPSDLQTGFVKAWGLREGKICRPGDNGEDEVLPEIVGIVRSYGIANGTNKTTGHSFEVFECDIETADGMEHFGLFLTDMQGEFKPSAHALKFAQGLEDMEDGEVIHLATSRPKERNKWGKFPTWVNWSHVDSQGRKSWFEKRPVIEGASLAGEMEDCLEALRKRPLWKDRTRSSSDQEGVTHLGNLCAGCVKKEWPTPTDAPKKWLTMLDDLGLGEFGDIGTVPDDVWGTILENKILDRPSMPKQLR